MFIRLKEIARSFLIVALAVWGAATLLPEPASAQAKLPLRIGAIQSVTGTNAPGVDAMRTLNLYVEEFNKAGGINGHMIEFFGYDDESSVDKARTLAKRLIENDKVHVIFGSGTGPTMAIIPLVEAARIPLFSISGSSVVVTPIRPYVFKVVHSETMAVQRLYDYMKSQSIRKIGLMIGTDGWGTAIRAPVIKLAGSNGIEIVAEESFNPRDNDMTPQLTNLRKAAGIQAILNLAVGQPAAIIAKNYRQLGISLPHYATHGVPPAEIIAAAGAAADNMILVSALVAVANQIPRGDPQREVVQAFAAKYQKKYNEPASYVAAVLHDGIMVFKRAVEKAGSLDPAKLRDAIEGDRGYIGVNGTINLSPQDHAGLDVSSLRMIQVRGKEWALLQ